MTANYTSDMTDEAAQASIIATYAGVAVAYSPRLKRAGAVK